MAVFASGCATTTTERAERAERTENLRAALATSAVSSDTADKVVAKRALMLKDIVHLSSHDVDEAIIIEAIQGSRVIYDLKTSDIDRLQDAGVEDSVINTLLASSYEARSDRIGYLRYDYAYPFRNFGRRSHSPYRSYHYRGRYGYGCY